MINILLTFALSITKNKAGEQTPGYLFKYEIAGVKPAWFLFHPLISMHLELSVPLSV